MEQLKMNLEVIINEDVRQYIHRVMPTFLSDISAWLCQDICQNLDDPETLFKMGNEYFHGTPHTGKSKKGQRKNQFRVHGQTKGLQLCGNLNYEIELVVEQNYTIALICYLNAADKNHPAANYMIALMFLKGLGVEMSHSNALEYFKKAALLGHTRSYDMVCQMCFHGIGVDADPVEALKWSRRDIYQQELFVEFMVKNLQEELSKLKTTDESLQF